MEELVRGSGGDADAGHGEFGCAGAVFIALPGLVAGAPFAVVGVFTVRVVFGFCDDLIGVHWVR